MQSSVEKFAFVSWGFWFSFFFFVLFGVVFTCFFMASGVGERTCRWWSWWRYRRCGVSDRVGEFVGLGWYYCTFNEVTLELAAFEGDRECEGEKKTL